jgi:protein-arginine kinase
MELTKRHMQINISTFRLKINLSNMKDFENMSIQEREDILEQIRNLPDVAKDPVDLFTESFNELSNNWSNVLKEFDHIYSDCCNKDISSIIVKDKENGSWTRRIHELLNQ